MADQAEKVILEAEEQPVLDSVGKANAALESVWCAALLALEIGVGKTLVALMVLAALTARRILICCPLRVVPVWEQQIERHLDLPLIVVTLDDSIGSVSKKQKLAEEKLKAGRGHRAAARGHYQLRLPLAPAVRRVGRKAAVGPDHCR